MRGSAIDTLRRWHPKGVASLTARLAVIGNLAPAGLAVALFVLLPPPGAWDKAVLLGPLAAIAGISFLAEARLKTAAAPLAAYFDASIVLALLALAVMGPLPALVIWIVPDAISRLVIRQDPLCSPGLVATVSSFALAVLAGYAVLELAAPPSVVAATPALFTAGPGLDAAHFHLPPPTL